ncbi:hypothetical protein GCM10008910_32910 [Faecalicatena orotica]
MTGSTSVVLFKIVKKIGPFTIPYNGNDMNKYNSQEEKYVQIESGRSSFI